MSGMHKDFWDASSNFLAEHYSDANTEFAPEEYRMHLAVDYLGPNLESLLDVGCGIGNFLELCPAKRKVGIDFSDQMIAKAKEAYPQLPFHVADITDLDLGEKFDAIVSLSVLPYIKDDAPAYENIRKHLNNGGTLMATFPNVLFNVFTDNEVTHQYMKDSFYDYLPDGDLKNEALANIDCDLKVTYGPESARGKIFLREENPITIENKLKSFGLRLKDIFFLNIHPTRPSVMNNHGVDKKSDLYKDIQVKMKQDWRSYFLASTFMIVAQAV